VKLDLICGAGDISEVGPDPTTPWLKAMDSTGDEDGAPLIAAPFSKHSIGGEAKVGFIWNTRMKCSIWVIVRRHAIRVKVWRKLRLKLLIESRRKICKL